MEKINKMGIWSFAKLLGLIGILLGFICGVLYSFGGLIIDALVSSGILSPIPFETPGLSFGTILAFGALIGMPLIFGAFGFILGLIGALLYNVYAQYFGGIKIDFE